MHFADVKFDLIKMKRTELDIMRQCGSGKKSLY